MPNLRNYCQIGLEKLRNNCHRYNIIQEHPLWRHRINWSFTYVLVESSLKTIVEALSKNQNAKIVWRLGHVRHHEFFLRISVNLSEKNAAPQQLFMAFVSSSILNSHTSKKNRKMSYPSKGCSLFRKFTFHINQMILPIKDLI